MMIDHAFLKAHWHILALVGGGGVALVGLYSVLRKTSTSTSSQPTSGTGTEYLVPTAQDYGSGSYGLDTGWTGTSPSQVVSPPAQPAVPVPGPYKGPQQKPVPAKSPAATTPASTPQAAANKYAIGDKVNNGLETITAVDNIAPGEYLDLTSSGGVYGSGVNVEGSFLGYAAGLGANGPNNTTTQIAQHGDFSGGETGIKQAAGSGAQTGQFVETNAQGETYEFGYTTAPYPGPTTAHPPAATKAA